MKRDEFFTYKNLGLDPRTNMLVTDDYLLTGKQASGDTIYGLMQAFHTELMKESLERTLFVYSALDGKCGIACPETFWKGGRPDVLIFPGPKKGLPEEKMQQMLMELVEVLNECVIEPTTTAIFYEVSEGEWELVHDMNDDDEIVSFCPRCHGHMA